MLYNLELRKYCKFWKTINFIFGYEEKHKNQYNSNKFFIADITQKIKKKCQSSYERNFTK